MHRRFCNEHRRRLRQVACRAVRLLLFFSVFYPATGAAQAPRSLDPHLEVTQYLHEAWRDDEGLPQKSVTAILQSQDGYLWLGTQAGLVRFDGISFTVFDTETARVLHSNEVRALAEDAEGGLWIGTLGGQLVHLLDGHFTTYSTEEGLPGDEILTLLTSRNGTLWIGTTNGLVHFDGASFSTYTKEESLSGVAILSLLEDDEEHLWIGTEAGLYRLHEGKANVFSEASGLAERWVRDLLLDSARRLWIGTDDGLFIHHGNQITHLTSQDGLCGRDVSALHEDAVGALWIGTQDGGLCRFYERTFSTFPETEALSNTWIHSLYQDREGNLWIGTDGDGIHQLRQGRFTPVGNSEGLQQSDVFTLLEDREGALWFGTGGGGLSRLHRGRLQHFGAAEGLKSEHVYALHEDSGGTLWVGTYGGGLCRQQGKRFACYTTSDGLSSDRVYSVLEDRSGTLWIGTEHGLDYRRDGRIRSYEAHPSLAEKPITILHEDHAGALWVGTYGGGLSSLRDGAVRTFTKSDGLSSPTVLTVHEDAAGVLWLGMLDGGLCRFVPAVPDAPLTCFTSEDGLPADDVLQILADDEGHLWLGTLQGIARVSKWALHAHAEDPTLPLPVTLFDKTDGLRSAEMNGGTQPPAWRTRDGRLWFGSVAGAASINPANIHRNPLPPPVVIEQLVADGVRVDPRAAAVLPPGGRRFTFSYTALSFGAPDAVRFKVRLEGVDEDWIDAGAHREAVYTNLAPGDYRFRVVAANEDGVWNEEGATFAFTLRPFFYQTWWFYLLCTVAALLCGAAGYRLRVRQLHARQRQLQRTVDEKTKALKELNENLEEEVQRQLQVILTERRQHEAELMRALNKAEASSRLKSAIFTNMSHEFRTPITSILGFAEILDMEVEAPLQEFTAYISGSARRLQETLSAVLDLAELESESFHIELDEIDVLALAEGIVDAFAGEAEKKGVALQKQLAPSTLPVQLDRSAVTRILHHLLSNAVKFTPEGGEVRLQTSVETAQVRLEVHDTGVGIGEDFLPQLFEAFKQESEGEARDFEGTGLGLAIAKRLVAALGGTIEVNTKKGEGSTFTVLLPRLVEQPQEAPAQG